MKVKTIKLDKDKIYSLCSCGLSNKLPYCDNNHRSKYFEQIKNGIFVRMAIIYKIISIDNRFSYQ